MPPVAAREKEGSDLGPLHTVSQTAFPRPRQEDCVPLHSLLITNEKEGSELGTPQTPAGGLRPPALPAYHSHV